jgi:catechol 2,3-dioxygenase-like lactoylglutathione lyase family enzyme
MMNGQSYNMHELQPVVPVKDVLATVDYYRDILGFHVDFADESYARVRQNKVCLRFARARAEDASWLNLPADGQPVPTGTMYIHLGHEDGSEDMDGLFADYQAKGVKIISEPTVRPYGLREFDIEDCNGYRFCFAVDARPYVVLQDSHSEVAHA